MLTLGCIFIGLGWIVLAMCACTYLMWFYSNHE